MSRQITVKPYQRAFRRPLRTAQGEWAIRQGFLLRIEQNGVRSYGEVAPLPEFGTETVAEAGAFLDELTARPEIEVPPNLPCCAFALSAASSFQQAPRDYTVSALLSAGGFALKQVTEKLDAGYMSLKWKIGVEPIRQEIATARSLLELLPAGVSVRLDANASLTRPELEQWLDLLVLFPGQVDYMEQPLACGEEADMAKYMQTSGVAIALDESLNGSAGLRWLEPGAWAGPLVIKAPLMGDVLLLAVKLKHVSGQVVFSSVFETGVGLENSLRLADTLPQLGRPIGFDTVGAFDDLLSHIVSKPTLCVADRSLYDPEKIWDLI